MNIERIGNAKPYVESPREREACKAALARLCESTIREFEREQIARIVAHDVAVNWPRIEAERRGL